MTVRQLSLLEDDPRMRSAGRGRTPPFKLQLLKWVGNKQRFAHEIIDYFPEKFGTYYEPFLGSGAVLGTLMPAHGIASDILQPLMDIWRALASDPDMLNRWYSERWQQFMAGDRRDVYEKIKARYNSAPNASDLLFLSRSCYGGVVRFRQRDGYMSTPCGVHNPINPGAFAKRVTVWYRRTKHTVFLNAEFESVMDRACAGDLIYCDPPYTETQSILYGAQSFRLERLFGAIRRCKDRGVSVALSIDGMKRSGTYLCQVPIPDGLFEREVFVNCGRSMLRRFQMAGDTLEKEVVADRLLLTY